MWNVLCVQNKSGSDFESAIFLAIALLRKQSVRFLEILFTFYHHGFNNNNNNNNLNIFIQDCYISFKKKLLSMQVLSRKLRHGSSIQFLKNRGGGGGLTS